MADPLHDIALAASDLCAGMPQEYGRFIEALKALEARCQADFYAADEKAIMVAQGRANLSRDIRTKLETCLQIRSQVENGKRR